MTADPRLTAAREYLAAVRPHKVSERPHSVLVREAAELRRQLGQVLDVIDEGAEDDGLEPYCTTCLSWVGMFVGMTGWHHFRGDPAPGGQRVLYEAGHPAAVGWIAPPGGALSPADMRDVLGGGDAAPVLPAETLADVVDAIDVALVSSSAGLAELAAWIEQRFADETASRQAIANRALSRLLSLGATLPWHGTVRQALIDAVLWRELQPGHPDTADQVALYVKAARDLGIDLGPGGAS